MCQLLGIKRSGYYRGAKKNNDDIYPLHSEMLNWVKKIAKGAENLYGSRRMKHAMNYLRLPISRQRARKLMNEAGVWVKYRKKYKVTRRPFH
jgi:2-polyprenyl-3-methyl-5-hydroxy-6-metoxy-1,4-benzoquinol methylase